MAVQLVVEMEVSRWWGEFDVGVGSLYAWDRVAGMWPWVDHLCSDMLSSSTACIIDTWYVHSNLYKPSPTSHREHRNKTMPRTFQATTFETPAVVAQNLSRLLSRLDQKLRPTQGAPSAIERAKIATVRLPSLPSLPICPNSAKEPRICATTPAHSRGGQRYHIRSLSAT